MPENVRGASLEYGELRNTRTTLFGIGAVLLRMGCVFESPGEAVKIPRPQNPPQTDCIRSLGGEPFLTGFELQA